MAGRNDPNKQALLKNRPNIVQNLANPDDVADHLYTKGLFTDEMRDAVLVSILNMFFFWVIKDTALFMLELVMGNRKLIDNRSLEIIGGP